MDFSVSHLVMIIEAAVCTLDESVNFFWDIPTVDMSIYIYICRVYRVCISKYIYTVYMYILNQID